MLYKCTPGSCNKGEDSWTASVDVIDSYGPFMEVCFCGRGSSLHAIIGPQESGHFICIPAYNAGCELAEYDDVFWNTERLSSVIGRVDALTIAQGLYTLDEIFANDPFVADIYR